jgi:hypothetical protein
MQAASVHREVAAEYGSERGAGDFRLHWHRCTGNIMRPVNIA